MIGSWLPAIHLATRKGHFQVVRFLVEEAGDDVNRRTSPPFGNVTPIHFAAAGGMLVTIIIKLITLFYIQLGDVW